MKKHCSKCKKLKEYESFTADKRTKTGRYSKCRECCNKDYHTYSSQWYQDYRKTINGKLILMFHQMKQRNQKHMNLGRKNFHEIKFTRKDFTKHMLEKTQFMKVYEFWTINNHKQRYTPTTDRIDNSKGYTLANIQCLSLEDNASKCTH